MFDDENNKIVKIIFEILFTIILCAPLIVLGIILKFIRMKITVTIYELVFISIMLITSQVSICFITLTMCRLRKWKTKNITK